MLVDAENRIRKTKMVLMESLNGIRGNTVGRGFVETVKILYHGSPTPIGHLSTFKSDNKVILIQPYDRTLMEEMVKSLKRTGLNAYVFSKDTIAVNVPPISG